MTDENCTKLKKEEFKTLFSAYFEDVRRYILYRSGNEEIATDIAQDTFMRIWEKQMTVDQKTAKGLLFKIAGDLYVSQYRREQVRFNFFNTFQPNKSNNNPEDELNFQELQRAYEAALKSMPEKQRTVFLMNRIDELKYREIAEQLDLSVKAIEKRMSQALEHLKTHLKDKISGLILFFAGLYLNRVNTERRK
jgi:RNA polymerase sigma-70 factor (ECF subfamily)